MDLSSLPEDQRQQLQKLQQQFQEHIQQQQEQQHRQIQDYASQECNPAQVQAYDQSYYAYHQYQSHTQSQQYAPQQQQHYAYYQAGYANAYQQQPQQLNEHNHYQQNAQAEPALIHPPGVSAAGEVQPEIAQIGGPSASAGPVEPSQVQQQQNAYYPQGEPSGAQQNVGYAVPPGLNPAAAAAVAALSQLTQFAGTMEAAEKAIALVGLHARGEGYGPMMGPGSGMGPFAGSVPMQHGSGPFRPQVGRFLHKGGGRRRAGPFRGSGRGHFGNRPPRPCSTGPPLHGRGRLQGRGDLRHFQPNGAALASHPNEEALTEGEPAADSHKEMEATQTSASKEERAAPNRRPPQAAWCEMCRVDCTSLEILEQHKNGKKHKKNLQRLQELENASKHLAEVQQEQKSVADSIPEVARVQEDVLQGEDSKQTVPESLTAACLDNVNKVETGQKFNESEQPQISVAEQTNEQGKKMNRLDDQRRGMKRKMRGGRGRKHMKIFDGPRRSMEPPKPKVVIPLICDLCNVKCDTQEVFDRHVAGKKHISKLKRFEGHQAMYGPLGLQALYPPNPLSQTLFLPQGPQQGVYGQQGLHPPPAPYMTHQAHHSTPPPAGMGSGCQHHPGVSSDIDGQKSGTEGHQQSGLVITETKENEAAAQVHG